MSSKNTTTKRVPVKRWLVLGLIILGAYAAFWGPSILKPISPAVVLPAEPTGLQIGSFPITNTMLATLLADLLLIALALAAWQFYRRTDQPPRGLLNAFEAIIEFLWNTVEGTAGKWARRIFPIAATLFLLILTANLLKLLPVFESIGRLEAIHQEGARGYAPVALFRIGKLTVYALDKGQPYKVVNGQVVRTDSKGNPLEPIPPAQEKPKSADHGHEGSLCTACEVIPFLRGSATDINFPFALAILTVLLTQVYGLWAQGPHYLEKFFQIKQLISGSLLGVINFGVGFLEIILELAKILSFGFRLFGNIFAGSLLLSIVSALTVVIVPAGLYIFEMFFGMIQAYVFFLLATIFISGATQTHG